MLYHRRLNDGAAEPGEPKASIAPQREEPKENHMVVMLSTAKINMCFLQAATLDLRSRRRSGFDLASLPESAAVPTVSLLTGTISGISSEFLSIRRKALAHSGVKGAEEGSLKSQSLADVVPDVRSGSVDDGQPLRKIRGHRSTMTTGDVKCDNIQFQLRRLCEADEVARSITTAIPEEAAEAKFQVNSDNYSWFKEDFSIEAIGKDKNVSLLMLECGIDNVMFRGGTERGSGKEVLGKLKTTTDTAASGTSKSDPAPVPQVYNNPLFARESGSVEIQVDAPFGESSSDVSSISSSRTSSVGKSTDGNVSDIDSDSDEESSKPLLKNSKDATRAPAEDKAKVKDELQEKDPEVARRTDITLHFSNIWFNLASPSSVKTVPANFHLYNSLVTTSVPVVTSWLLPIQDFNALLASVAKSRQRFVNSVVACLLAQALPGDGRIPKAVSICGTIQVSGAVPTVPSLRLKVWVGAGLGLGLGLRERRIGTSPETWIDPVGGD